MYLNKTKKHLLVAQKKFLGVIFKKLRCGPISKDLIVINYAEKATEYKYISKKS